MPLYKLLSDHELDGVYYETGVEVEYDGPPGSQMEPLDDDGHAAHAVAAKAREEAGDAPLQYGFEMNGAVLTEKLPMKEVSPKFIATSIPEPGPNKPATKRPIFSPTNEHIAKAKELGEHSDEEWAALSGDDKKAAIDLAVEEMEKE